MWAHSDIRTVSGFVITTEPLGFVLTKEVNVFLLRVWKERYWRSIGRIWDAFWLYLTLWMECWILKVYNPLAIGCGNESQKYQECIWDETFGSSALSKYCKYQIIRILCVWIIHGILETLVSTLHMHWQGVSTKCWTFTSPKRSMWLIFPIS